MKLFAIVFLALGCSASNNGNSSSGISKVTAYPFESSSLSGVLGSSVISATNSSDKVYFLTNYAVVETDLNLTTFKHHNVYFDAHPGVYDVFDQITFFDGSLYYYNKWDKALYQKKLGRSSFVKIFSDLDVLAFDQNGTKICALVDNKTNHQQQIYCQAVGANFVLSKTIAVNTDHFEKISLDTGDQAVLVGGSLLFVNLRSGNSIPVRTVYSNAVLTQQPINGTTSVLLVDQNGNCSSAQWDGNQLNIRAAVLNNVTRVTKHDGKVFIFSNSGVFSTSDGVSISPSALSAQNPSDALSVAGHEYLVGSVIATLFQGQKNQLSLVSNYFFGQERFELSGDDRIVSVAGSGSGEGAKCSISYFPNAGTQMGFSAELPCQTSSSTTGISEVQFEPDRFYIGVDYIQYLPPAGTFQGVYQFKYTGEKAPVIKERYYGNYEHFICGAPYEGDNTIGVMTDEILIPPYQEFKFPFGLLSSCYHASDRFILVTKDFHTTKVMSFDLKTLAFSELATINENVMTTYFDFAGNLFLDIFNSTNPQLSRTLVSRDFGSAFSEIKEPAGMWKQVSATVYKGEVYYIDSKKSTNQQHLYRLGSDGIVQDLCESGTFGVDFCKYRQINSLHSTSTGLYITFAGQVPGIYKLEP